MKASRPYAFYTTVPTCVATLSELWTWTPRSLCTLMVQRDMPLIVYFPLTFNLPKCLAEHPSANSAPFSEADLYPAVYFDILPLTTAILVPSANLLRSPSTFASQLFTRVANNRGPSTVSLLELHRSLTSSNRRERGGASESEEGHPRSVQGHRRTRRVIGEWGALTENEKDLHRARKTVGERGGPLESYPARLGG